ncbi:MAG: hypothetical protein AAF547_17665 [Actinomycetota bacterium]
MDDGDLSNDDRIISADTPAPEVLSFLCPRCGLPAEGRYFGPCRACNEQLQATYVGVAKDVEAPEYEPKMNVTPNAIATKE